MPQTQKAAKNFKEPSPNVRDEKDDEIKKLTEALKQLKS